MSSNCRRVTGAAPPAILLTPSHQAAAKPARYMSPYQRTASGPIENATGSICGWTSMRLRFAPGVRDEVAPGRAQGARAPGEPQLQARVPVADRAVDHTPAAKVRKGGGHDRRSQPARHQAHYGLHLYGFLRNVEGEARPGGEPRHDIVKAGRNLA